MSSLPTWAYLSIVAAAALLCPVLAFLTAIAVEILIGVLEDAGLLAILAFVAVGAVGWWFASCGADRVEAPQSGRERRVKLGKRDAASRLLTPSPGPMRGQRSIGVRDGLLTVT